MLGRSCLSHFCRNWKGPIINSHCGIATIIIHLRCLTWAETNIQKEMMPDVFDPITGRSYGAVVQGWRSNHLGSGGMPQLYILLSLLLGSLISKGRSGGVPRRSSWDSVDCGSCCGASSPAIYSMSSAASPRRPQVSVIECGIDEHLTSSIKAAGSRGTGLV